MTEEKPIEEEIEVEFTSRSEYIASCYNAIAALDCVNEMTNEDAKRKRRIIRKSVKILFLKCTMNYLKKMKNN